MRETVALCFLLLATVATADAPVKLERICHDGELIGIRLHSDIPLDGVIRFPQKWCAVGDA